MPSDSTTTDPLPDDESTPGASGRRLTLLYVFALSTVAVLTIGAQWLIQRQLHTGDSDSRVINLAGRQRMLSQRLAKSALALQDAEPESRPRVISELEDTLELWARGHDGLQRGDDALGLPGGNSEAVTELFAVIEPHYRAMEYAAKRLAKGPPEEAIDATAVETILRHENRFLSGMDAIVLQYVVEAERRVARLSRLEFGILALTLLVLLAEGVLIFRPAVRRIEQAVARLETVSDRLRRAKDEAEHGNAAKTRFLANVSHELRTPMTAVLGMTELAQETDDEEERIGYLKVVEEAGESLLSLLNDLIDTARIDAGQLELAVAPFEPQKVVERVTRMMRFACSEKGLELIIDKPPQRLPALLGDARRLEQILLNLIGNAIKWTESGSVSAGCEALSISAENARLRFWVRDTGIGISAADQQRIFEPFTQLPSGPRLSRGGAGLGLAICRRIADAMDAKLDLVSTPGVGTNISLTGTFPTATHTDAATTEKEPTSLPDSIHVLVVEDTEVNQLLIRRLLQREGHRVEIVGSGEEGIDVYQNARFDLVLVDLQLPGMDGAATARHMTEIDIEQARPSPPMVCITAHTGPAAAAIDDQFSATVTKPLKREPLMQSLARVVQAHDGRRRSESLTPAAAEHSAQNLDHELANAFLKIAPPQLDQLREALDRRAVDEARVLAHRFRGQIGYFDLPSLEKKLATLDKACESRDLELVDRLAPEVVTALQAALESLQQRIDDLESAAAPGGGG